MMWTRVILVAAIPLLFSHCERKESVKDYSHVVIPEPRIPDSQRWEIENLAAIWNKANGISDYLQLARLRDDVRSYNGKETLEDRIVLYRMLDLDPGRTIDWVLEEDRSGVTVNFLAFWAMKDAPAAFAKAVKTRKRCGDHEVDSNFGPYGGTVIEAIMEI